MPSMFSLTTRAYLLSTNFPIYILHAKVMISNITSLFRLPRAEPSASKEAVTTTEASFLKGAKNTKIKKSSFSIHIHQTVSKAICFLVIFVACAVMYSGSSYLQGVHVEQREAVLSLIKPVTSGARESRHILHNRVATNAVLNTGGRAEDAKCHPGTREEVIGLIEQWMGSRDSDNINRMLWLSGPAGGGKTAIMKTIAERSERRGIHTVNFFFFRGDSTRNGAQPLVATLVYQILQLYPAAHDVVATILSNNPLLLDASIQEQFDRLISPLSRIIRESSPKGTPIILLLDGLDECDVDAKLAQEQVLRALDGLVTQDNSPFLALVASRPEPHIHMVFNQLVSKAQSIFLDEQYSPEKDIQRFVTAEFSRIKASHRSAHLLHADWPSESDIEGIVDKSSGQFIYAATVMRFLALSSAVPSLGLKRVQGIVPAGRNSPFTELDSIYTYILDQVDDREATLDLLSSQLHNDRMLPPPPGSACVIDPSRNIDNCNNRPTSAEYIRPLPAYAPIKVLLEIINPRYTDTVFASCVSDLSAIVQYRDERLVFYHASMTDFLLDPSRSNLSYVDLDAFVAKIFPAMWESHKVTSTFFAWNPFNLISKVQQTTSAITHALISGNMSRFGYYDLNYHKIGAFLEEISRLYYPHDIKSYAQILRMWTTWTVSNDRLVLFWFGFEKVPFLEIFLLLAKIEKWASMAFSFVL